jgi:hypothetical protein
MTSRIDLTGLLERDENPFLKKYKDRFELKREKCFFAG